MSNYIDVMDALGELETEIDNLATTELVSAADQIDDVKTRFEKVESELVYIEDDMAELAQFQDLINDTAELEEMMVDFEALREGVVSKDEHDKLRREFTNLSLAHKQQAEIILALLTHIRAVHRATSEEELNVIVANAKRQGDQP